MISVVRLPTMEVGDLLSVTRSRLIPRRYVGRIYPSVRDDKARQYLLPQDLHRRCSSQVRSVVELLPFKMRSLLGLSSLLLTSAFSNFVAAEAPFEGQNLNVSNITISPGSLSSLAYPWGPNDFTAALLRHGRILVAREACFVCAVEMLAGQAAEDFNGRMRSPRMTFTSSEHPAVVIIVMGASPTDRIRRRFALWGVARMMAHMVSYSSFRDSTFQLNYRGRDVGQVYIGPLPTPTSEIAAKAAVTEPPILEKVNFTAISNVTEMLSWQYQYFGFEMTMDDVFMGTVGALVLAARPASNDKLLNFVGGFPPYTAVHHWASGPGQPPLFNYNLLIKSIQTTAMYALNQMNFHELGVRVMNGVKEVGWGGYVRDPALNTANYPPLRSSFEF